MHEYHFKQQEDMSIFDIFNWFSPLNSTNSLGMCFAIKSLLLLNKWNYVFFSKLFFEKKNVIVSF